MKSVDDYVRLATETFKKAGTDGYWVRNVSGGRKYIYNAETKDLLVVHRDGNFIKSFYGNVSVDYYRGVKIPGN